jgi:hypothetical protein
MNHPQNTCSICLFSSLFRIASQFPPQQRALKGKNDKADFMTTAQDGGKVVSLTHRPPLPPRKYTWYSFLLEAESTPGP